MGFNGSYPLVMTNIAMAIDLIYHLEYHGLLGFNGIFNGIYNRNIMGYTIWL
jgi:hypothetical protein